MFPFHDKRLLCARHTQAFDIAIEQWNDLLHYTCMMLWISGCPLTIF